MEKLEIQGLQPADELLLYCAWPELEGNASEQIRKLACRNADWIRVLAAAQGHGILALVHERLEALANQAVPPKLMRSLREFSSRSGERNRYLAAELFRVLDILEADGIPAAPFRGPAEASYLYGSLALRYFNDISLLINKQHMRKAADLLLAAGYRPVFTLEKGAEAAQIQYHAEYRLYRREDRVRVRLQWQIAPGSFAAPLDFARLQGRFRLARIGEETVPSLGIEDIMLHLSVSVANEFPPRLALICDVARLVERSPDLDWDRLAQDARALGCRRRLHIALQLAQALLGARLPRSVGASLKTDAAASALAAYLCEHLFRGSDAGRSVRESIRLQVRARERMRDKARYCLRMAVTPSGGDLAFLALPVRLWFLYRLLRPVRLAGQYLGLFAPKSLAEFGATPMEVAEQMLALAGVGPGDVVYDLGCGDGRLIITAAKRFGARGVGIDIDPARVAEAHGNARNEGVEHLVTFRQQNAMEVDLSPASTVMLYMGAATNLLLRPRLQQKLQSGTRVVSHAYDMGDWAPLKTELVAHADGVSPIHLWRIGAQQAVSCAYGSE